LRATSSIARPAEQWSWVSPVARDWRRGEREVSAMAKGIRSVPMWLDGAYLLIDTRSLGLPTWIVKPGRKRAAWFEGD
jgi:hypothetical protein